MSDASLTGESRIDWPRLLLWRTEEVVAGLAMVVVIGSVLWGVLTRYVFPQPAAWSYEVATIGFAWLVFFGAAAGVRYRLHSDIDVLVLLFPPALQRAVAIFNFVLLFVLFLSLTVFFAIHSVHAHQSLTIALNLPRSVLYAPLALASAFMLLRHVQVFLDPARFPANAHEANIT
ncbi:TRAP transporter small permease [Prosthecomicrobium sp. N25]|uniref:TRAP transporter small permease n=1 Tax=Prosthecomicrobium sp. N25 TaxID=3129254 RepID=UPI003076DD32